MSFKFTELYTVKDFFTVSKTLKKVCMHGSLALYIVVGHEQKVKVHVKRGVVVAALRPSFDIK